MIPVSNRSTGTVELPPNVAIGSVVALSEKEGTLCEESEVDIQVSQLKSACAENTSAISKKESWHQCCRHPSVISRKSKLRS